MLAKKNRLSRTDFSHHFKQGKRYNTPFTTLIHSPHPDNFHGAVVVSKKVSKQAVRRNTIRRRAYAQLYQTLKNKQTGVYIIIIKPPFSSLSRKEQHQTIKDVIEQLG